MWKHRVFDVLMQPKRHHDVIEVVPASMRRGSDMPQSRPTPRSVSSIPTLYLGLALALTLALALALALGRLAHLDDGWPVFGHR